MNVEEDRLSSLPDDLIHKILSFLELEHAIRSADFSKFVDNVLSHRNYQIHLSSVFLYSDGRVSHEFIKRFLEYVCTHNVQQLTVSWSPENEVEFPLSLYSSRSLQHLDLHNLVYNASYLATPAWDLPALTTLHLYNITVFYKCTDIFSKCPNLKNLNLNSFTIGETNVFKICHPKLSNLTLESTYWGVEVVDVVAPQLKNLTIIDGCGKHLISAPGLTSLVIKGIDLFQLIATQGFPSLEKVDLHICPLPSKDAPKLVSLLQQLHSVKLLTLDLNILQVLSSSMGLMSNQPSPFSNVKIVKFSKRDLGRVYLEVKETTSLLDRCDQSSIFTMVSREEIEVMSDIILATLLIAKIRFRLKKRKALTDTKQGCLMEQVNAPRKSCKRKMHEHGKVQVKKQRVQSAFEKQWHFGKLMTQIKKGKSEGLLTKLPTSDTRRLISLLQHIDGSVTELSASKRPVIQETFSIVCEEAAVVTNSMLDWIKIRCNKKPKRSNV